MRHLNLKSIALLTGLATLVALAGCGGGSGDSTTAAGETAAPAGKSESTTASSPTPKQKPAKNRGTQKKQKPAKTGQEQVEKEIRKYANSGKPIPVDSPVAKKIIESLSGNGSKKGKKGSKSIAAAIEQVVSPPQGGGGGSGSGGGGGSPGGQVEKILEQIQK